MKTNNYQNYYTKIQTEIKILTNNILAPSHHANILIFELFKLKKQNENLKREIRNVKKRLR